MEEKTKVVIIGQQPLFRQGIKSSLSQMRDMEVLEEVEIEEKVLSTIEISLPDVVLLDLDGAPVKGLTLCRAIKLRLPSVATIVFTSQPEDGQLFQTIKAQASAYLSKTATIEELAQTIRRCAHGEHPINEILTERPKVAEQILQEFYELSGAKETANFISPLTPRETEILSYMAQGYLNKEIARELNVSEQTVKNHITSILRKLNVNARTQAVIVAIKKGLVSIEREQI
jgi:DNA-binding NarL/FixJ family response regulator